MRNVSRVMSEFHWARVSIAISRKLSAKSASASGHSAGIAGDGPMRREVEKLMAPFGDKVRFLGRLDAEQMARAYRNASLFFWPGVNEAYGMVYLEAQAKGLPVVAQDRPGVRDVLAPGDHPAPKDGPQAMAKTIRSLLNDAALRAELGRLSRAHVAENHLLATARSILTGALSPLIAGAS